MLRASVPMASCAHNGNSDVLSGPLIAKSFVAKAWPFLAGLCRSEQCGRHSSASGRGWPEQMAIRKDRGLSEWLIGFCELASEVAMLAAANN